MSAETPVLTAGPAGREAAAILLMLLEESEAATLLSRLDAEEVQQLGEAMYAVADVSEGQVNHVLDEFVGRARKRTTLGFGAEGHIRGVMSRALGDERADSLISRIVPAEQAGRLDALKWMDPADIAEAVAGEHPQIAATVLAHLDPEKAGRVLERLDEAAQADLVYRVARLGPVTQSALDEIGAIFAARPRGPPSRRRAAAAGRARRRRS